MASPVPVLTPDAARLRHLRAARDLLDAAHRCLDYPGLDRVSLAIEARSGVAAALYKLRLATQREFKIPQNSTR